MSKSASTFTVNDVEIMMGLGLTSCQARVYLALCGFELLDVRTLSKCASVSRQDLYRITKELKELVLIENVISTPIAFKAIAIDKGVNILVNRRKEVTRSLERKTTILLKKHKNNNKEKTVLIEPEFVMVPAKEAIIDKINLLINQAQKSIDIVSSWKRFSHLATFSVGLEEAWSRGVKCRFIIEKPEESKSLGYALDFCRKTNLCEVRFIPSPPNTIVWIFDGAIILLVVDPKAGISESSALWSTNNSILSALKDYFDILWITALETPAYSLNGSSVSY